jgi:hypothetical protein
MLALQQGFNDQMILEAVAATGWTRERDGQWSLQNSKSCRDLVQLLNEMLTYFDRPQEPSPEILRIKIQIDELLEDEAEAEAGFDLSFWHYARLDLLLREDLAKAARELTGIWEEDVHQLDVGRIRGQVIHRFRQEVQAQSTLPAGRMAASARASTNVQDRRSVG